MESAFWRLEVLQKAYALALEVFAEALKFPSYERDRVADQLCRAALSVPSNIAEGEGRETPRDQLHFLNIASGSRNETELLLKFALDRGYLKAEKWESLNSGIIEVGKMLNGLIAAKRRRL